MPDYRNCEYVLLRFASDPIRNEFVNVGVVLFDHEGSYRGARVATELRRLRCLQPALTDGDLRAIRESLEAVTESAALSKGNAGKTVSLAEWLAKAEDSFSHSLQMSARNGVLTLDPAAELERLYAQYAEPPRARTAEERELAGRRAVLDSLRKTFDEENVLAFVRTRRVRDVMPASDDPFRFDFYYFKNRLDNTHKFIQAVALDGTTGSIKELGYTVERMRSLEARLQIHGVFDPEVVAARVDATQSEAESPADGEPVTGSDGPASLWAYHRRVLERAGVELVPLGNAVELAATIRRDLHIG
jgi:hypothetical protein